MKNATALDRPFPLCLLTPTGKIRKIYTCTMCKNRAEEKDIDPNFIIPPAIRIGKERQYICPNCLILAVKEFGINIEGKIIPLAVLRILREEYANIDINKDTEFARFHWLMNVSEMIFGNPAAIICKRTSW